MIEPGGIPQYTGDFGQLEKAVSGLRTHATGIRSGGKDVHSRFQATAAYYKAPEAEQLFSSTRPVMDTADEFAGDIESLADALDTFIFEAKPHADRLKQLKLDAIDFVDSVRGDDDWTEDKDKVEAHQALMDGVAAAREGFQTAERDAANKIDAISPAVCRPRWVVDDGTHGLGMYGQSADSLKGTKDLPWGSPEGRTYERWSLGWWGNGIKSWAWEGIAKDSIWGGIDGLGTLLGYHGEQARDQAWDGLRRTAVGGYAYGMDLFGQDEHLSDWQRDSKAYAKEFGKQFIAYDTWEEDPARAHATVSFNLLTLAAGPFAAASRLGKGGTLAKAAGSMAKIGDALDPLSGTFKAAKALSDLPKVSQVLANVSDHLQLPKSRLPDSTFDLDHRYRIDRDGNFIPLNRDGTPNLDPAKHEPSATDRQADARPPGEREPVEVGGRAPGATAHASDGLPPRSGHDASGRSGAGDGPHGPRGEAETSRAGAGHGDGPSGSDAHDGPADGRRSEGSSSPGHSNLDGSSHDGAVDVDQGSPSRRDGSEGGASDSHEPSGEPGRFSNGDRVPADPTGPMRPEQEAEVAAALGRAKMPLEDQQRALLQLRKGAYGEGIAAYIARGEFDGIPEYRELLNQCKQKDMLPAVHQTMEFTSDLQSRGVKDLAFEYKRKPEGLDLDVLVKSGDKITYGCQLKVVGKEHSIGSAARKIANDQLSGRIAGPKVAILDIHSTKSALTESTIRDVEHYAKKTGATFELRFEDGSVTFPANGRIYP
ncbi:hypothetical protein ACIO87_22960 [Streptomyces sp. NPDC087218]|uniref:hypothetical protein n=1 Tax=Streptomyces sp. NPDC087218 TaxID=3365769 RepID=UPI00380FDF9B